MLHSIKYTLLFHTFNKRKCFETICTNSKYCDKRSEIDKYILEVKKNFTKSSAERSKVNRGKNYISNNKGSFVSSKPKIYEKQVYKKLLNNMYFTGNLNCIIDKDSQANIDALLTQKLDYESKTAILSSINNNKIPSFESLLKLSSSLSKNGDASTIKLIQNTVKQNYKSLSEGQNNFEHYLCEALFRSDNKDEALQRLAVLVENCKNLKRVKETACFLIRMIAEVSENHQRQASEIADKFISIRDENKPAAVFLEIALLSKQNHLYKLASLLLEKHPELLLEREEVVTNIVNKAQVQSDHEVLQQLIEILLKYGDKQSLSLVISTQLNVLCSLEYVARAKEVVVYAKECGIYLSANSIEQLSHLLHKKKKPELWTALMTKLGLKFPPSH